MDYIKIAGYKSIKDLTLDLKPINVLIGANGAGKSNFVSFFRFLNAIYNQQLQGFVNTNGGLNKFLYNGRKITNKISCELSFNNHVNSYSINLEAGDDLFIFSSEKLWYHKDDWDITNFKPEAVIKHAGQYRAKYIREYLNELKVYHFHDTGKMSPFNNESKIDDCAILASNGGNLASYLYALKEHHPIVYKRIIKIIQSIAPYFNDFILAPNMGNSEVIKLAWLDNYSDNFYNASDLSDGTMRFIALTTLFTQSKPPKVIIIDEPELGLHPFAISKLAGLIKSVAEKGTQVIVCTQSTDLVSCFEPDDVIVVDKKNGESTFERLKSEDLSIWLEDFSLGEIWKRNIINKGFPNN